MYDCVVETPIRCLTPEGILKFVHSDEKLTNFDNKEVMNPYFSLGGQYNSV